MHLADGTPLTQAQLDKLVRVHGQWLRGEPGGTRLALDGASLDGASLIGASLNRASLNRASLNGASLNGASLIGASLNGASLNGASLIGASLTGASLIGASLNGASLKGASLNGASLPHFQICPEVGAFTAFKALRNLVYAEIVIPADAPRTSSLVGRKCRAAWVDVVALYDRAGGLLPEDTVGYGLHDMTEYRAGVRVEADGWDDDVRVECTHGIHFFITLAEAHAYA